MRGSLGQKQDLFGVDTLGLKADMTDFSSGRFELLSDMVATVL